MVTTEQFDRTRRLALHLAGIDLAPRHRDLLDLRARCLEVHDADALDALLGAAEGGDPTARRSLLGLLTTNFTGFFRHPWHFDLAAEQALWAAHRRGEARLWSAAAATGEEPYSLAMEFRQEVMVDRSRDKAVAKLKELGLPGEELALVELAKRNSDRLINLEDKAFAAAAAGDLPTAIGLVHGAEYRTAKAAIIEPIQEFRRRLAIRLDTDVQRTRRRARAFDLVAATSVAASALAMLAALAFFYRKVVAPLAGLKKEIDQLLVGRKDVRVGYQTEASEVGDIARSLKS
jgi:methyl-accepting chemotaxis protein